MTVDQGARAVNPRLRALPAVDRLVEAAGSGSGSARWSLLAAAREVLEETRAALLGGAPESAGELGALAEKVRLRAARLEASRAEADLLGKRPELACRFGRAPKERRSRLFQHLASGGEQAPTSRSGSRSGRFDQPVDRRQGAKPWIDRPSALIYGHK